MGLEKIKGMNLAQVIEHHGTDPVIGQRPFLLYRHAEQTLHEVTFAEFYHQSLLYGGMIRRIREEQDKLDAPRFHVGFFMQNVPEVLYLFGGCAFTNSTLVGINNAQVGEKLAVDVNKMDVDVLFADEVQQPRTGRTFVESVLDAHKRFGLGTLIPDGLIARAKQEKGHPQGIATIDERLSRSDPAAFTPIHPDDDNAGIIIFTSGTTGAPKGIDVLWKKVVDVGVVFGSLLGYSETDVGYVCMPLNHSNSIYINLIPAILNGARLMLRRRFTASNFVRDIEETGATIWNSVGDPVMYVLATLPSDADLAHLPLRTVVSTGTNAANREAFTRIFGLEIFSEVYGSTEVGAVAGVTPETPDYSVGRVIPGKDVRAVDEATGRECPPARVDRDGRILNFAEAVGEIVVSQESLGASAFSGYYNMPEESAEKIDERGFYHMGDLGAIEERDGERYILFLGRTGTDRLRTKGENFSTTSVEEIILKAPGVANAAIIGIPYVDSTENDNPIYVLEVDDPEGFDVEAFHAHCVREVPPYALPGFIRLMPELPRTDTHKIKKPILLHQFIERTPETDADPSDRLYIVGPEGIREFETEDYGREMARCTDPAVRARFQAVTRRTDLF